MWSSKVSNPRMNSAPKLNVTTEAFDVQIVSNLPAPSNGGPIDRFWACWPCGPTRMAGAAAHIKRVISRTNPGPTTLNKKVWICDICHKQIHVRKQISIRCNRIEHWVHLRCAGIRQAQYTDTWTCHLHRESRLTPHKDITPPHRSRPCLRSELVQACLRALTFPTQDTYIPS